jgi:hypothetical protein
MGVMSADVDSRRSLALVGGTNLTSLWQCCPQRGSLGLLPGEQFNQGSGSSIAGSLSDFRSCNRWISSTVPSALDSRPALELL